MFQSPIYCAYCRGFFFEKEVMNISIYAWPLQLETTVQHSSWRCPQGTKYIMYHSGRKLGFFSKNFELT